MTSPAIPEPFIQWSYEGRAKLIRRQAAGGKVPPHEIFLGFSRHTPTIVSHGPAGLNASIKGTGFVPKPQYLQETLDKYLVHIEQGWREGYQRQGLALLVSVLYGEGCRERIDFARLGSLEMALDHTWENLRASSVVTLLFYQPPAISYEVRGRAEIHEEGSPYHRLLNAQHDVYHKPHPERWPQRPAYIFIIEEIYDNSATKDGFGRKIYGADNR
jgi:hypothetical protein